MVRFTVSKNPVIRSEAGVLLGERSQFENIFEEQKIACSKKCKKVAKFGYILKNESENDALKAFEQMLKKKKNKSRNIPIPIIPLNTINAVGTVG